MDVLVANLASGRTVEASATAAGMSTSYLDGRRFKAHREALGLSVAEAAARIRRSAEFVETVELNGARLRSQDLGTLAAHLGCHVDDLTGTAPPLRLTGHDLRNIAAGANGPGGLGQRMFGNPPAP